MDDKQISDYEVWVMENDLIMSHQKIAEGMNIVEADGIRKKNQEVNDLKAIMGKLNNRNNPIADFYIRRAKEPTYIIWCKNARDSTTSLCKVFYTAKLANTYLKKHQEIADRFTKGNYKFYIEERDDSEDRSEGNNLNAENDNDFAMPPQMLQMASPAMLMILGQLLGANIADDSDNDDIID
jgi:hypothetical protein